MMIIFWDKDGVPLIECLPRGTAINCPYYASIIERLRSVILEKRRGKVSHELLLLHENAPIYQCNIVQGAIRQTGFIELNQPVSSPDIAPTNYHLFSNVKKFLGGKNFSSDDEAVTAVEDYVVDLNSELFCKDLQSLHDLWQRVVASEGQYI